MSATITAIELNNIVTEYGKSIVLFNDIQRRIDDAYGAVIVNDHTDYISVMADVGDKIATFCSVHKYRFEMLQALHGKQFAVLDDPKDNGARAMLCSVLQLESDVVIPTMAALVGAMPKKAASTAWRDFHFTVAASMSQVRGIFDCIAHTLHLLETRQRYTKQPKIDPLLIN